MPRRPGADDDRAGHQITEALGHRVDGRADKAAAEAGPDGEVDAPEGKPPQQGLAKADGSAVVADDQLDLPAGRDVVVVVSGGNNDLLRYAEVVERSLIHEGLKHYFLVDFPQEPGMLRQFLDEVLGPDDDIALFEYVKRNNRETGPALVGIELGSRDDLAGLLQRMATSSMDVEPIAPDSPLFRFIL